MDCRNGSNQKETKQNFTVLWTYFSGEKLITGNNMYVKCLLFSKHRNRIFVVIFQKLKFCSLWKNCAALRRLRYAWCWYGLVLYPVCYWAALFRNSIKNLGFMLPFVFYACALLMKPVLRMAIHCTMHHYVRRTLFLQEVFRDTNFAQQLDNLQRVANGLLCMWSVSYVAIFCSTLSY